MLEKNNFLLYLACLSILVFSYSPNLQFNFLYSDDYSYLFPKIGESKDFKIQANLDSFFEYFYKIGRPLTGYLIFIQNILIENIEHAKIFRFFSVVLIWFIFIILYLYLVDKKFSKFESFFISLSTLSLPVFNLSVSWLTLQQSLLSIIFVSLSFLSIKNSPFKNSFNYYFRTSLSILLIIFSLFLYPVASMFFFVFYFIEIFFNFKNKIQSKTNLNFNLIINPPIIFFSTLFLSFLILKFYFNSSGSIEINQFKKFLWYFLEIFPLSINFFYPSKSIILYFFYLIFIFFSIHIILKREYKNYDFNITILIFLIYLFFSYFLFLPLLISGNYYSTSFRIIIVLSSFNFIFFLFILKFLLNKKIYSIFLIIISIIGCYSTYYQSYNFLAKPQSEEYLSMSAVIKNNVKKNTKYIHIFRPNWYTGEKKSLKIFNGSDYGIYSSSISTSIKNMVYVSLESNDYNPNKFILSSSVANPTHEYDQFGEKVPKSKNLLLVDFSMPTKPIIKQIEN